MARALTSIGRYQVVSELGRGSMGVVYRAFDPVIGRTIAIKTMLTEGLGSDEFQDYKARFQREAQAAGLLSHPNIVTVYDFGEDSGVLYLAMEFLEGKTLQQLVNEQNILPIETIIPIYEQVCSALELAHTQKIVHRDIKPANIMILESGLVKVTDFGVAKMMSMGMTQAGQILGTPNYMSPEQVKGGVVDGRSDIFALGVILYELVTGEKPFAGQNITTLIYKIIHENPIPPRELDASIHPGLSYVISKALAKNPAERFQTCREFAEDLKNYKSLGGVGISPGATVVVKTVPPLQQPTPSAPPNLPSAPPAEARKPPRRIRQRVEPALAAEPAVQRPISVTVIPAAQPSPRRSSPLPWVFMSLALVGVLGGGYYFLGRRNPPTPPPSVSQEAQKPPAVPSLPKLGGLTVDANIPGVKISIDGQGQPDWVTPHTFAGLPAGSHEVVLSKEGYEDVKQAVTVDEGGKSSFVAQLVPVVEHRPEPPKLPPASPRTPPAPKVGDLSVASNVEGAKISVDGRSEADWVTPHSFSGLSAGYHQVTISKEGYDSEQQTVNIEAGQSNSVRFELSQPSGEFSIVTDPPGAEVTIDGRALGKTPVRVTLPAGQHSYAAVLPGLPPAEGTVTLNRGSILTKRISWK